MNLSTLLAGLFVVAATLTFAAIVSPAAVLLVGGLELAAVGVALVAFGSSHRHDVGDVDRFSHSPG